MKTMKVLSAGKVLRCALFALTGEATRPKIVYVWLLHQSTDDHFVRAFC